MQIASLWLWLSGKHEDNFPDRQRVEELALDLTRQMDAGLRQITADRDPKLTQPKGQSPQQQLRAALEVVFCLLFRYYDEQSMTIRCFYSLACYAPP